MVVDVRILSRKGVDRDERMLAIERQEIEQFSSERDAEREILERAYFQRVQEYLAGQKVVRGPAPLKPGQTLTAEDLKALHRAQLDYVIVEDEETMKSIGALKQQFDERVNRLQKIFEAKVERLRRGDELPPGVLKLVKVYIASKRKLQPGDKMAGRHGNKGVVSRILPVEDMPYKEDGTPMDIILNPLGVPSRMNVGQILETHLGAAAYELGRRIDKALKQYRQRRSSWRTCERSLKAATTRPSIRRIFPS